MKEFRFFPKIQLALDTLIGSVFSYTLDGTNYLPIATLTAKVHSGWNFINLDDPISNIRGLKFESTSKS